jgi:o-succinylbenzoate synthase
MFDKSFGAVERIEVFVLRVPLNFPFETSFGVQEEKEALIVRIDAGGVTGWGECVATYAPMFNYETTKTALHVIKEFLAPALSKADTLNDVFAGFQKVRGHQMAKAALENALLDVMARQRGVSISALLGGGEKMRIPSGISIGITKGIPVLIESIENALTKKYHRIKLKIKKGTDIELLKAVRERFPDIPLTVDANAGYTPDDASHIKRMDDFNLIMIEQPYHYDDLYQHSFLQPKLWTPICLDESIKTLDDARAAMGLGSCRIINIKQGRVGGLINSRAISRFVTEAGGSVWSGGMLETGLGRAVNLQLQTLPGFDAPGDTAETSRFYKEDIVEPSATLDSEGFIAVPLGPGIGVTVLEERLHAFSIHREVLFS